MGLPITATVTVFEVNLAGNVEEHDTGVWLLNDHRETFGAVDIIKAGRWPGPAVWLV